MGSVIIEDFAYGVLMEAMPANPADVLEVIGLDGVARWRHLERA